MPRRRSTIDPPARELGSVYTPPEIARRMVAACLDSCQRRSAPDTAPCRILDPACGDGAFLVEVFDELCRRSSNAVAAAKRLAIFRDHIFGADLDPAAVATLQSRLLERIGAAGALASQAAAVVAHNIRCGNSLTGPGLNGPQDSRNVDDSPEPPGIDWQRDFPAAASAGGFDIVIGNPPYVRERNAKPLFDLLASTELGRRWREARMDLWYYFLHRGLDLVRPGGTLSFIVNSYWTSSRGASRLIDRLNRETRFEEIVPLGAAPVFAGVSGRHMIFRLRKRCPGVDPAVDPDTACRVVIEPQSADRAQAPSVRAYDLAQRELFQNGRLIVAPPDPRQALFAGRTPLTGCYQTRQGMAENPPAINRRLQREFADRYRTGEGVFVLDRDEVERLELSATERGLLRPYYDTQVIGRYQLPAQASQQVLYLTRRTAESLAGLPAIAAHLDRFRPILERRREVRQGKSAWWHLHWPREEAIFLAPRILAVQMGREPQFVFAEQPAFVGFSVNLIVRPDRGTFALDALTGILNSQLAAAWFGRHAKRRGVKLEINAHVLREYPLPAFNAETAAQLGALVRERQNVHSDAAQAAVLEREIEELVEELYQPQRGEIPPRCG